MMINQVKTKWRVVRKRERRWERDRGLGDASIVWDIYGKADMYR
jgi:hypothetical protein